MKLLNALRPARTQPSEAIPLWHSYEAALNWLVTNQLPEGGIAVSSVVRKGYPEVTGYIVPTLLEAGAEDLALDLTRWLISIQRPDGGFDGHDGEPYLFDTGQVMRGFVATLGRMPEVEGALRSAADWMLANADENGVIRPKPSSVWSQRFGDHISENIHLYTLSPLVDAGRLLNEPRYTECAQRSLEYFVSKPDLLRFKFLTHFYGYVLEALVDLGRDDLAWIGLQPIVDAQLPDGTIPGVPNATWICSPGAAQLAIVAYKLGITDFADAAIDRLQQLQLPSGGFYGSYGPGAAYGVGEELSWACKYFLDACHWRIRRAFDEQKERFSRELTGTDPRLAPVLATVGDGNRKRILDVGCGRGAFLRDLQQRFPQADLTGVDLSAELLSQVPAGVATKQASMLDLPYPDGSFDVVLCIEALEHAIRIERAVSELCRVLKPGGKLIIIDKDAQQLGLLRIERREKWFNPDAIANLLRHYCSAVSYEHLTPDWDEQQRPLFISWQATRSAVPMTAARKSQNGSLPYLAPSPALLSQYRNLQQQVETRALVQDGFKKYQERDLAGARLSFLRAARREPRWLLNRGIISITLESLVGPRVMGLVRRSSHATKSGETLEADSSRT